MGVLCVCVSFSSSGFDEDKLHKITLAVNRGAKKGSALNLGYPTFQRHFALALNPAAATPLLGFRFFVSNQSITRARLVISAPLLQVRLSSCCAPRSRVEVLLTFSSWARFSGSTSEWRFRCLAIWAGVSLCLFRAMAHVFLSVFLRYILRCIRIQLSCFYWHRGVPSFVGVVLGTPRLFCSTIIA
ncbi:uncharacterized protein LOC114184680 [Vigna unguiculata]|uniref:uncharacterized protein LOC114184680 n=1 Tax=Vigna unguiculata TaxID=3917 RepID=UPI0010160AE6|nr:uncharacterized protein LOC114184680 [Vigna unguiculata]